MTKGRLTRHELGWLLTQEAQGAATRLRQGVQILRTGSLEAETTQGGPAPEGVVLPPKSPEEGDIHASLDALDDMMRMLSNLHAKPVAHSRRGRIDLAALLWEVAPEARVQIEPGGGTEVFGDEAELRRMLHVLTGHGGGLGSSIHVGRSEGYVEVAVVLGPDQSPTMETERIWLSRMAVRYGGRHELEGGMEVLALPADGEREEKEALIRELDEARRQGEVYARELAAALDRSDELPSTVSSYPPASTDANRIAVVIPLVRGIANELKAALGKAPGRDSQPDMETLRRRVARLTDLAAGLGSVGELALDEPAQQVDLAELVHTATSPLHARAKTAEVDLVIGPPEAAPDAPRLKAKVPPRATSVLVRELVTQAIDASPKGATVEVGLTSDFLGTRLTVDDAGPPLPASARRAYIALEVAPGTYGRPSSVPIHLAAELAATQGAQFELTDAPLGGLRVVVTFPARGG